MIEIEAKIRVDDLAAVAGRLRGLGARLIGRYVERNMILDSADGALRLSGCGLRIRSVETIEGEPAAPTLTYKGKVLGGPFKSREEIEIETSDAGATAAIMNALGFRTIASYRKRRDRWLLDECNVELDDMPLVGTFVEIEGGSEAAVREGQRRLGLEGRESIPTSYVRMLIDRCRELNRPPIDIE